MKTETVSLEEYLLLGGKLSGLNLAFTKTTYYDNNRERAIAKIEPGKLNSNKTQLYLVTFGDNTSYTYAPMWIETKVEFVLKQHYING